MDVLWRRKFTDMQSEISRKTNTIDRMEYSIRALERERLELLRTIKSQAHRIHRLEAELKQAKESEARNDGQ